MQMRWSYIAKHVKNDHCICIIERIKMDKIDAMRIFVQVADLSSFSQTADRLGLPKGSVSNAIQQLENQYATQFLYRTTRKVTLTEDGKRFYQDTKNILNEIDALDESYYASDAPLKGRICVDMPSELAKRVIRHALPDFLQAHPALELLISSNDRRIDFIQEGFDFVVRIGNLDDSGLIKRHLGDLQMLNCASPAYLDKYGYPQKIADLEKHHLIYYQSIQGSKNDQFEYIAADGKTRGINMPSILTVNTTESYKEACLAGLGIIQVPRISVAQAVKNGTLTEILTELTPPSMPVSILYPNRRNVAKRVAVFMDWLSGVIQTDYLAEPKTRFLNE